jgi:V8-like Glu-specific endopeptidase
MRVRQCLVAGAICLSGLTLACASDPADSVEVQPELTDVSPADSAPGTSDAVPAPSDTLPLGTAFTDAPDPIDAPPDDTLQQSDDTRVVVGKDTRTPIRDTSVPPFSSVVLLRVTFPSTAKNTFHLCTGTLVSEDAVLTAAHCLHDSRYGGRATAVTAIPGAYAAGGRQGTLPGIGSAGMRRVYVPAAYDDSAGYGYDLIPSDYALLWLDKPLGRKAGYREFGVLQSPLGRYAQMFAYHGDRCPGGTQTCGGQPYAMHQSDDTIRRVLERGTIANHYIDMVPGASGAGITSDGPDFGLVFAINVSERHKPDYNRALLITEHIAADLRARLRSP